MATASSPFRCALFMRLFIKLLVFFVLMSCKAKRTADKTLASKEDTINQITTVAKSFRQDTVRINNIGLVEISEEGKLLSILTFMGDSVIKAKDYYFKAEYPDINRDGYKDIRVFVFSSMPNQAENYLYNRQTNRFHRIENSDLDIKKIKGTERYFSYNSIGCSDNSWESNLSKLEGFKEVNVGRIEAKGCGDKNDGIYIYKVEGDKETLVQTLPIDKNRSGATKWHFIEQYWTSNYNRFK
jgi:hypothetical protein